MYYYYKDSNNNHYKYKSPLWRETLEDIVSIDEEENEVRTPDVYTEEELDNQAKFIPITEQEWNEHQESIRLSIRHN